MFGFYFFWGGILYPSATLVSFVATEQVQLFYFGLIYTLKKKKAERNTIIIFLTNAAFTLTIPLVCIFNLRNRYPNIQKRDQKKLLA